MAEMMTVKIEGLSDLMDTLRDLPNQMQGKVLRSVAGTGAGVLKAEILQRAPTWDGQVAKNHPPPGTLKRAVYMAYIPEDSLPTRASFKVGIRRGKGARTRNTSKSGPVQSQTLDAYYWAWVEFGHYARVNKKMSKSAKLAGRALGVATWVPARPFVRPAFEAKKAEALRAMADKFRERVPEMVTKARGGSTYKAGK